MNAKQKTIAMYIDWVKALSKAYEEVVNNRDEYTERWFNECYGRRQALYGVLKEVFYMADIELKEIFDNAQSAA